MWPRGATSCKTNTARANLGVGADLDIAEHFCPSAEQHAVTHFRVPVAWPLTLFSHR
jgi:hypothetical protein